MRVTNIDTLSAFIDRLISERIKLYHFETKLVDEKSAQHQRDVVDAIKDKLEQLFIQSMSSDQYDYIDEKRTFGQERVDEVKKLIDNMEELTVNDLDTDGKELFKNKLLEMKTKIKKQITHAEFI